MSYQATDKTCTNLKGLAISKANGEGARGGLSAWPRPSSDTGSGWDPTARDARAAGSGTALRAARPSPSACCVPGAHFTHREDALTAPAAEVGAAQRQRFSSVTMKLWSLPLVALPPCSFLSIPKPEGSLNISCPHSSAPSPQRRTQSPYEGQAFRDPAHPHTVPATWPPCGSSHAPIPCLGAFAHPLLLELFLPGHNHGSD